MSELICGTCQCPLVKKRVDFSYLTHTFFADALRCPICGQVYLSEELVKGRVAEVEMELEDK
ncbi:MAG: hypothetical protein HFF50_02245 [Lawsonibacter sp.]|nr:hypothetical protein [Lawsonibacter sp.]